jgi:hypothetical protein
MNEYRNSLEKLGYSLQDCGSHWRTRAIFRNGKTSTSLIIYKDSGVWRDFGGDEQAKPFTALVKETLKTEDPKALKEYLINNPNQKESFTPKEEVIEMEKIYPESYLEKLLPMKTFYEKRGISAEVQTEFKCGYAGGGKMYRRIVFPIYNLDGQIHGFSGRSITNDENVPKWKHMGKKSSWLYPHQLSSSSIEDTEEVILVESIGDCLALHENGFKNVLVTFGLDASSAMISYLNSFNLKKIIIATNNDKDKESNSGGMAAIKTAAKLSQVFDFSLIRINPPLSNDFGDMALEGKDFKEWYERSDKWKMDDDLFQKWVLNKIDSIEKLKKNIHCKKLIKTINGS